MYKVFLIKMICAIVIFVGGKYVKSEVPKKADLNNSISYEIENTEKINDIESKDEEIKKTKKSPEEQKNTVETNEKKQEKKTTTNVETKENEPIVIQENTQAKENKKEETIIKEEPVVQEIITESKQEEVQAEQIKEEYIYNDAETQRIIADINEIAKRNKDLWRENGEKLYKIEVSSSLVGKNYMSPYRKAQVEGTVLNVFPVKFLVYAQDHKKNGYTVETRYYIDIANY